MATEGQFHVGPVLLLPRQQSLSILSCISNFDILSEVNNSYACQNSHLLNRLLKGELNFQGFVMSDWQAQHSGVSSAMAGLDMTMPGDILFDSGTSYWGSNLTIAVLNGTVPQWRLDDMATRIIAAWYYVGRDNSSVPINFDSWTSDTYGYQHYFATEDYTLINEHVDVRGEHRNLIRQIGSASTVLLKNTNNTLPLTGREKFTAVFGSDAGSNPYGPNGCPDRGCDNGTLGMAWVRFLFDLKSPRWIHSMSPVNPPPWFYAIYR